MPSPLFHNVYLLSREVEHNTILNRGILDAGGVVLPWIALSNNPDERKERIRSIPLSGIFGFIDIFVLPPLGNRMFAKYLGLSGKIFGDKEHKITHLSNKFLKTNDDLKQGIKELSQNLGIKFTRTSQLLSENPELLRKKILLSKNLTLGTNLTFAVIAATFVPRINHWITKQVTGRSGYSAEFSMISKEFQEDRSQKSNKKNTRNLILQLLAVTIPAILLPVGIYKSLLGKPNSKLLTGLRKSAAKFDYTKGIYLQRLPLFLLFAPVGMLSKFMAARDKYERIDVVVRAAMIDFSFFALDYMLNGITGRFLDKHMSTKLLKPKPIDVNKGFIEGMRNLFPSVYTLTDIDKMFEQAKQKGNIATIKQIERTKKAALSMYWGHMIFIMAMLGLGVPFIMNRFIKHSVQRDEKQYLKTKESSDDAIFLMFEKK